MTDGQLVAVRDIHVGDIVDLEGDAIADPGYPDNQVPAFEFEYMVVRTRDDETPDCIALGFDTDVYGFPPDHRLMLHLEDHR